MKLPRILIASVHGTGWESNTQSTHKDCENGWKIPRIVKNWWKSSFDTKTRGKINIYIYIKPR